MASYSSDTWGNLLSSSESFTNGWTNPYRYDGRDGARYDTSDGLYWLAVRAYDPSIGRFLSRDPLGRAPLFLSDNPYVYAGNNPLSNVDPSGQKVMGASSSQVQHAATQQAQTARVQTRRGVTQGQIASARTIAQNAAGYFLGWIGDSLVGTGLLAAVQAQNLARAAVNALGLTVKQLLKNGIAMFNSAVVAFDVALVVPLAAFAWQWKVASDDYWRSRDQVAATYSTLELFVSLVGTLVLATAIGGIFVAPEMAWEWAGIAAGVVAALIVILPHVKQFVDAEERVLGYPQS